MHIICVEKNGFCALGRRFPIGDTEIEVRELSEDDLAVVELARTDLPPTAPEDQIAEVVKARRDLSRLFVFSPEEAVELRKSAALRPPPAGRLVFVGSWPKSVDAAEKRLEAERLAASKATAEKRTAQAVERARKGTRGAASAEA